MSVETLTVGERIRRLRRARRLTQVELAAEVGVVRQTVGLWEVDRTTPQTGHLFDLARALGVPMDAVLKGPKGATP